MVMIDTISQINDSRTTIDVLVDRSEGEWRSMIDWGAGLACMIGLVSVLVVFQETKRSLKRWQMHGFPMSLYFVGMLILNGWNQGKFAISQCRRHSFPNGVEKD